ncbi:MAG TPA: cyclic nucleotide-binding domain-containing protein [Desulfobacteraceae bacterium]|nr:MAG: cyclic nucleotide-binding protein [Deltaproteobacteria bacterium]HDH87225.1 cyclic nucleotide-binding domain-containing protein [Desulfobacteraceae bacterium]
MFDMKNIKTIGRYQILKQLGQASVGAVYLGKDPYIGRQVAIKVYHLPNDTGPEEIEAYKKSFFVEAQSAGRLMHPNIVTIYDADLQQDFCYITMEYIDGSTLKKFCKPDNLLPVERVVKIVFNVCKGLEYAHQNGVIHRDIKPSNIILSLSGQVKITDFSIAYVKRRGHSTLVKGLFGSPSYMSPEQVKEELITERNDIFSLGSVLYELLTGKKAFDGENEYSIMYKIVNDDPPPILELKPELPKIFADICSKALAKDPSKRYQGSMDFAYDLRLALRSLKEIPKETHENELFGYIKDLPFFKTFTENQIDQIVSACDLVKVEKGETIIKEGEIDDSFYILISGQVVVKTGTKKLAVLEKGQCFGEMAYLTGEARTATIITKEECILLKVSSTLLEGLSKDIQLLFFKNFTQTIIKRLSKAPTKT